MTSVYSHGHILFEPIIVERLDNMKNVHENVQGGIASWKTHI